ncbi:transcriptional regulator [Bacterioplanes sanyensis]|uniref:ArsR/SmtB family transcription factor n=1 Tax=Bacterioplanes sanyensis TaxID=1249553 RepID=UPI00198F1B63|nr:metalloregulator ArsR/SmtB family transcription factor [Bacterioplanes sanyensis]GGY41113.1 transcriptional regulator [Bacterioplanes sanyensis]
MDTTIDVLRAHNTSKDTAAPLSDEMLELIAQRFRLLADPMRLRILHQLQGGEKSVTELVQATEASQPNVSKHLSTLRTHGLVKRRQQGNLAYFSIGAPFVFDLCNTVCDSMRTEWERKQNLLDNL